MALPGRCRLRNNPFDYFDAIYCINLDSATQRWQDICRRFDALGIAQRICRSAAVDTPQLPIIGCSLSHRTVVDAAYRQGLRNVLVFEDDAIFLKDTLELSKKSIAELSVQNWNLFHLGGPTWGQTFPNAPGCSYLRSPCWGLTCTHAVAYNRSVYRTILDELPHNLEAMRAWIAIHHGIDIYLRDLDKRFLSRPSVASQPCLLVLGQEAPDLRDHYTLGDVLPGDIFRLHRDWHVERAGERVMLNHRQRGQLALDASAAMVVGLVNGERTAAEIREILRTAYPQAAAEIADDVERPLATLFHWGALTRS
jgi:hypothetical protein